MCIRGRVPGRIAVTGLLAAVLVLASAASVPGRSASAATMWQALTGAQSGDHAIQALAFLPNELTVDAGDSITWTFPTDEVHTVTFAFANSGVLLGGQQFTVAFATPGTFAFRCLIQPHDRHRARPGGGRSLSARPDLLHPGGAAARPGAAGGRTHGSGAAAAGGGRRARPPGGDRGRG